MAVRELVGLASGVLVLAALSVAIIYGGNTAAVLNAMGSSFSNVIKAATLRG